MGSVFCLTLRLPRRGEDSYRLWRREKIGSHVKEENVAVLEEKALEMKLGPLFQTKVSRYYQNIPQSEELTNTSIV